MEPWQQPGGAIVVVVDPEETRRRRLAQAVRHAGARPLVVATPLEAIALVEAADEPIAAVAIAVSLETQTRGDELARFLATEHPEVRLAVIPAGPTDDPDAAELDGVVLPSDGRDATAPIRTLVT